jgi:serine/threonine-protein kinase
MAERVLTRFIGPMAQLIVRKAAARARDRLELGVLLSESIDDPETRIRFVDTFRKSGSEAQPGDRSSPGNRSAPGAPPEASPAGHTVTTPSPSTGAALDPPYVDQVTARLAVYIGPIARIVAKNATQKAKSRSEFVTLIADHLGTQDRAAFLAEMGYGDR